MRNDTTRCVCLRTLHVLPAFLCFVFGGVVPSPCCMQVGDLLEAMRVRLLDVLLLGGL